MYGSNADDEMADVYLQVIPVDPAHGGGAGGAKREGGFSIKDRGLSQGVGTASGRSVERRSAGIVVRGGRVSRRRR